jgi:hypothetical protein
MVEQKSGGEIRLTRGDDVDSAGNVGSDVNIGAAISLQAVLQVQDQPMPSGKIPPLWRPPDN